MSRVRVDLPERFDFSTEIPLQIRDVNAGGHLGASSVLPLTSESQWRFMDHLGFRNMSIDGNWYIMADAVLVFKSQGFWGQIMKIDVAVTNFSRKSCDFIYRITDRDSGEEIARVKTGVVFFNYKTQKSVEVPAKFRSLFSP